MDADELLSDPSIEAVYVATPTSSHAELTIAAARRGKHVLCEKPLSLNPAEAEEMVRVCREQGVTLGHGTKMRYNACHVKMREMIRDGSIGQPVAMHALFLERWPSDLAHLSAGDEEIWKLGDERIFTWRQRKRLGGGPMADMGVHVIDTMVFMMGRVKEVASFCDTLTSELDVEDTASVLVKFENGVQATIECHSSVANFKGPEASGSRAPSVRFWRKGRSASPAGCSTSTGAMIPKSRRSPKRSRSPTWTCTRPSSGSFLSQSKPGPRTRYRVRKGSMPYACWTPSTARPKSAASWLWNNS